MTDSVKNPKRLLNDGIIYDLKVSRLADIEVVSA